MIYRCQYSPTVVSHTACRSEPRIWDPEGKEAAQMPRKASTEKLSYELRTKVETIGPTTQETSVLGVTGRPGGTSVIHPFSLFTVLARI